MSLSLTLLSPAKLNLFLHVLGKREDGYHEVSSLYQAISLSDYITFSLSKEDTFTCNDVSLVNEKNLVLKARDLFRRESKLPCKMTIHLQKNIPVQAGLGGASSNAATTLWAMNVLLGRPFAMNELMHLAQQIGSDVCFFFSKGCAYCTGRGEIVKEKDTHLPLQGFVAKPCFALATKDVFRNFSHNMLQQKISFRKGFEDFLCSEKFIFFNDLETSAFSLIPEMKIIKDKLQKLGFHTVVMTGSGSCFFCFGEVENPNLQDVQFFPFVSIQRNSVNWYS